MITNNKVLFSAVGLSGPIRFIVKIAFVLLPFYPNQCRLLGGPPLVRFIEKPVDIS